MTDMRVGRARGHRALANGIGPAAAAPCGPLACDPHSRGGPDSGFPATRTGRFQPRPIFGESLSRLRHPAPRGRRSWERARRPSCRRGIPEKCIPAAHARVPPPQPRGTPRLAGAQSPQHLNPRRQRGKRRAETRPALWERLVAQGAARIMSLFPSTPLLTSSPGGAASGRSMPEIQGTPRNLWLGTLCRKVAFAEKGRNGGGGGGGVSEVF